MNVLAYSLEILIWVNFDWGKKKICEFQNQHHRKGLPNCAFTVEHIRSAGYLSGTHMPYGSLRSERGLCRLAFVRIHCNRCAGRELQRGCVRTSSRQLDVLSALPQVVAHSGRKLPHTGCCCASWAHFIIFILLVPEHNARMIGIYCVFFACLQRTTWVFYLILSRDRTWRIRSLCHVNSTVHYSVCIFVCFYSRPQPRPDATLVNNGFYFLSLWSHASHFKEPHTHVGPERLAGAH